MTKIAICDDEQSLLSANRAVVENFLQEKKELATIEEYGNGEFLLADIQEGSYFDLILLDINLPVFDGYFICREIRKTSEVPIIVVTSRDSEVDELMSMNLGADDFVTKPYNTQILLARIAALLKRSGMNSNSNSILTYKDFKLNLSNATVIYNDKNIELTKNEVKILSYLINHKGEIVSRELLMEHLWNSDFFVDDSTLTVNITRLRKKLDEIGIKNVIETRRGLGYIMR